jgi:CheY-like chemotaxis protein
LRSSPDPRWSQLPIIALTAHASEQDGARARSSGFDAYLSKPFRGTTLSRAIAGALRQRALGA